MVTKLHKKLQHYENDFIGISHVILVRLKNVWHCDDHLSGLTPVMSNTQRILNACIFCPVFMFMCPHCAWDEGGMLGAVASH